MHRKKQRFFFLTSSLWVRLHSNVLNCRPPEYNDKRTRFLNIEDGISLSVAFAARRTATSPISAINSGNRPTSTWEWMSRQITNLSKSYNVAFNLSKSHSATLKPSKSHSATLNPSKSYSATLNLRKSFKGDLKVAARYKNLCNNLVKLACRAAECEETFLLVAKTSSELSKNVEDILRSQSSADQDGMGILVSSSSICVGNEPENQLESPQIRLMKSKGLKKKEGRKGGEYCSKRCTEKQAKTTKLDLMQPPMTLENFYPYPSFAFHSHTLGAEIPTSALQGNGVEPQIVKDSYITQIHCTTEGSSHAKQSTPYIQGSMHFLE
ncbi:hypothetical protein NE237_032535 [Protea cynaroides]|uniref:Uncharacterized protein n=1 Tax=Protea cynaroides TaxID=273540 RepID=A0A9Q0L384_9MAGN|nr:hypothetical protein NE237_032535 [Protea cynaroides]